MALHAVHQRSFEMQDPDQPLSFRSPPGGRTQGGAGALGVHPAVREPLVTTQGLGAFPPPLPAAWGKEGCECNLVVRRQPGPECTWCGLDSPLPALPCPLVPLLGCQQSSGTQRAESRETGRAGVSIGLQRSRSTFCGGPLLCPGLSSCSALSPARLPRAQPRPLGAESGALRTFSFFLIFLGYLKTRTSWRH